MLQLDLFGGPPVPADPASPGLAALPEPEPPPGLPDPGQLGLFDARAAQLRRARAAAERGDLDGARSLLAPLACPGDPDVARGLAVLSAVHARLAAADRLPAPARALALLACAGELEDAAGLRGALHAMLLRRAARAVQAEQGDDACLAGWPVGVYHARAGDLPAARASLTAALARARRARTLYALGDLAAQEGDPSGARDWYCEALARDPFDIEAQSAIRDREILELPDIARYELELDLYPEAWSAPLGMITGVFRIPGQAPALAPVPGDPAADRPRGQLDALASAQAFIAALVAAETAGTRPSEQAGLIAARRAMKRLQPGLFAAYLERRSR